MAVEEQTSHDSLLGLDVSDKIQGGQSFDNAPNRTITKLAFKLVKVGAPSGDVTFTIRKTSDASVLNSKVWGDASTIPTTFPAVIWQEVTFNTPVLIEDVCRMLVEFSGGDSSNQVAVSIYTASDIKASEELWDNPFGAHDGDDCTYRYTYGAVTPVIPQVIMIG